MVKHFCDRCGKEMTALYACTINEKDTQPGEIPLVFAVNDLCKECHAELVDWFRHPVRYQELYKKLHDPENHKKLGEALKKCFDDGFEKNCQNCGQPVDSKGRCIPYSEGKCVEIHELWIPKEKDGV